MQRASDSRENDTIDFVPTVVELDHLAPSRALTGLAHAGCFGKDTLRETVASPRGEGLI